MQQNVYIYSAIKFSKRRFSPAFQLIPRSTKACYSNAIRIPYVYAYSIVLNTDFLRKSMEMIRHREPAIRSGRRGGVRTFQLIQHKIFAISPVLLLYATFIDSPNNFRENFINLPMFEKS